MKRSRAVWYRRLVKSLEAAEIALAAIDALPPPLAPLLALEQLRDRVRVVRERQKALQEAQQPIRALLREILGGHDVNDLLVAEAGARLREVCGL